jgi:hypothetical protein
MAKEPQTHPAVTAPATAPVVASPPTPDASDVVLLCGQTEDGAGMHVLRARKGNLETGELRALKQGAPIHNVEVVRLHPREGTPLLCDVEVQYDASQPSSHAGPARVNSPTFVKNWERIFGTCADTEVN